MIEKSSCIHMDRNPTMSEPQSFFSIYAGNPDMQSALETFVLQLRRMTDDLDAACREHDFDQLRELCDQIKRDGRNCGFEPLAQMADDAMQGFHAEEPNVESLEASVREIIDAARRVKAG